MTPVKIVTNWHVIGEGEESRVVLQKPTVTQLAKKFPASYATRSFVTVLTKTAKYEALCYIP
jgi:hypothetical protein